MNRMNNIIYGIFLILIVILLGIVGHYQKKLNDDTTMHSDTIFTTYTDTLYLSDTFYIDKPKPYKVETIRRDTIYTKDTVIALPPMEEKLYKDTLYQDADTMYIETLIEGMNANIRHVKGLLLKARISEHSETIINTHIESKKRTLKDRLFLAPAITVGYDPINKDMGMVIGISAGFKF